MVTQYSYDFFQDWKLIHGLRQGFRVVRIEGQAGVVDVGPGGVGQSGVGHFKPLNGIKPIIEGSFARWQRTDSNTKRRLRAIAAAVAPGNRALIKQ